MLQDAPCPQEQQGLNTQRQVSAFAFPGGCRMATPVPGQGGLALPEAGRGGPLVLELYPGLRAAGWSRASPGVLLGVD